MSIQENDVYVRRGLFYDSVRFVLEVGHATVLFRDRPALGKGERRVWLHDFQKWAADAECINRAEPITTPEAA